MTHFVNRFIKARGLRESVFQYLTKMGMIEEDRPLLSFGVIADVQYADADDGFNFTKTNKRYYRTSLQMLEKAIHMWNNNTKKKPQFVLQLGDALDGINKRLLIQEISFKTVLDLFAKYDGTIYHIWGNHEFYCFPRTHLLNTNLYSGKNEGSIPVPNKVYYTCQPHPKLLVIALDCYEISLLASLPGTEEYETANQYMVYNSNSDKNSAEGLEGDNKRFVRFNGALSEEQLIWLTNNLKEASRIKQNVIIIGHCGLYSPATDPMCLCWNAPEILSIIHAYSDTVLCYFSGHDHAGGMATDEKGILHIAFHGVLENNMDSDFGTVYVYNYKMELVGNGRIPSLTIPLKYKIHVVPS